ncbi:hypothetical protein [Paraburkholderia humisilvae]|uniref:Uncharacterized protein n=1 Tax=Paraburkholderia humisilvae TaxID=627669 RepID=A0A6J5E9Q7_9BURK|nr:hypothetical protein [Paraburkholderia humisilvae]CAB3762061.1 hypothetical protein LMG29542_04227 [Paraburkholderia humisilvae]
MNKALRLGAFVTLTFYIGRSIANIFLGWPAEMPDWLYHTTLFALRVTGLGDVDSTDDAEVMATLIVALTSWTLTGVVLWLLAITVRRFRNRGKT